MYVFKVGIPFLLIIFVVKSDDVDSQSQCKDIYMDIYNKSIDINTYCYKNNCVVKCCGADEILNTKGKCKNMKLKKIYSQINYSNTKLYSWDGSALKESKKNLVRDFVFVRNTKFDSYYCSNEYSPTDSKFYVLEDGSTKLDIDGTQLFDIKKLDYCVEFRIFAEVTDGKIRKIMLKFVIRENTYGLDWDAIIKSKFVAIGMLISCFFLMLVLVVYYLLDELHNIVGLVLMAYIGTLFVTYLLRAVFVLINGSLTTTICKKITPCLYYAALSSFFWLSVMSFDLWSAFGSSRRNRKCSTDHRNAELRKFKWYGLYAWGVPLLVAIGAVIIDNIDLTHWHYIIKPPFDDCLANDRALFFYLHVPIAIIITFNVMVFLMIAFNIWRVKRAVQNCRDSRVSNTESSRFSIYLKLAVLMGISWCLELLPALNLCPFIVLNSFNVFLGVIIFILFVFKKTILIKMCKRFHINNKFVQNFESSQSFRNVSTKTMTASSIPSSTFKSQDRESRL